MCWVMSANARSKAAKKRRAKVGGYRDYFDDDQVAVIEKQIRNSLDSSFGYH